MNFYFLCPIHVLRCDISQPLPQNVFQVQEAFEFYAWIPSLINFSPMSYANKIYHFFFFSKFTYQSVISNTIAPKTFKFPGNFLANTFGSSISFILPEKKSITFFCIEGSSFLHSFLKSGLYLMLHFFVPMFSLIFFYKVFKRKGFINSFIDAFHT